MGNKFSYETLWSEKTTDQPLVPATYAKYDFAVAYPAPETQPLDELAQALRAEIDSHGDDMAIEMAHYPHRLGYLKLRQLVINKLEMDRGFRTDEETIALTAGSGEAIALVIQTLTNPGDSVIVEEFVYLGTLNQLSMLGVNAVETRIDSQGIIPSALEVTLSKMQQKGELPKLIYTIPENQNPTGSTLPTQRRLEILRIAHKFGVPIVEDDCYVDLRFEGESQPSFRALDDSGIVIHVASFSKLIAPGLRMGYLCAEKEVILRALSVKHGSGPNQFAAYAIDGFLRNNMSTHKAKFNLLLKEKRDSMDQSLTDHFSASGATWSKPQGGCYTWLLMPSKSDISSIRDAVFEEGVGYIAGDNFSPSGKGTNCARLCFAFETTEKNYEGIATLARLFRRHNVM